LKFQRALYGVVALCLGAWPESGITAMVGAPTFGTISCAYASWISPSLTCGQSVVGGQTVGYPIL
jgi:hypothetical protein